MKAAVLGIALVLALSSHAYAVLRPRLPRRTMPPLGAQTVLPDASANPAAGPVTPRR